MGSTDLGERAGARTSPGPRHGSRLAAAAGAACAVAGAAAILATAGTPVPAPLVRVLAISSIPLALAAAFRDLLAIRRGPELRTFAIEEGAPCNRAESERVRAASQVRGGLGGAGHLHPLRLVFPALAWLAAASAVGCAAGGQVGTHCFLPLGVLAVSATAAAAFPARPFWYLEQRDGRVLLFPPFLRSWAGGQRIYGRK